VIPRYAVAAFGLFLGLWFSAGCGAERSANPGPIATTEDAATQVTAPEFTGVTAWLNSQPLKLADQKGKVVVVHFWTNGCINCIHNYPYYREWQDRYKNEKHFVMVGIHTPEFDAEKDIDTIKERLARNKLTFPVAVDSDQANWKAWSNEYWPCIYLVDKTGNVRFRWEGELGDSGYKKVTAQIDDLLGEKSPKDK
jgi:thiol-disulfide isomerase/thioredoxin